MTTKDFDKLGAECFNQLHEINPKGGMKEFIRMAVEFGYRRAVSNNEERVAVCEHPFHKLIQTEDGFNCECGKQLYP